ncbi:uncharacterized protein OCT59_007981 [Rhizophagus irregularis]|uniref:J domain-containing protein n=3 Tax=Rhizophagus irregularis TaxID=588596 RepID=U9TXC6_RHIID|nr:hypothetical protein GLOIN_2v1553549 [Rhizophagus irregularis DAOM 181602=DAOM 197198]EXX77016.1 Sis1p [Rhizophagus irregularis DAOM 197198w]PKY15040.1 DnaJ-domain-containing protein [Rhizophagus irregularis]POG76707.1 hypothetical protein GLOIN_2v1553549 [Rhizophagus irregularis DAOM 181602=DAOM 197198]UZO16596.1 hypothetical protein OCT59_007981 [Rhizophagus irregularis]CAB4487413.1 unnamed protein product [Rhizophagus irregularis]|eukprot:XP_025183573.1 hypothetical protein GLOIN_2v1553549 [Rhizophagus irregularis DAOM 181602=DAOM 197198]
MDLREELKENKRQLENGEINENEYSTRRKTLLNKWTNESKKTEKIKPIRAVNKPKEMDLYEILKLKPSATKDEIGSSYRKLAKKYHPDKNDGVETEEWGKISKAYQILSDDNSRTLYDNFGTINNSLGSKASFNSHVGGELWQSYIGNLEIGLWLLSFMDNSELENLFSTGEKERRHAIRVSSIVRYLQNKLFRSPEQDESSQFEKSLCEEAKKLSYEHNGKELLSTLGKIYIDEAEAYLKKSSTVESNDFIERLLLFLNIFFGYLTSLTKNKPNLEEVNKLVWKLSKSEISSIARETCEKVLHDKNRSEAESIQIAEYMCILGKVWLEESKL